MADSSVKSAVTERGQDAWARQVSGRIASCSDLFAAGAVYHYMCLVTFTTKKTKESGEVPRGRPVNAAAVHFSSSAVASSCA